ncbi:reverse transcriptase domain-containing protein [Tanacetum coccineum]
MAPWPFYQWGMDILGPLTPAKGGAKFVIVAIDYLTKWIEAKPLANSLVERANRSLMEGIKTRLKREKAGWVDELPNVLWARRTSIKQSNGETPFSLTYSSEAVIPAEIGIPTYRTLMIREGYNKEEIRLNLDLLVMEAYKNGSYKLQTLEDKEGITPKGTKYPTGDKPECMTPKGITYPIGQKPKATGHELKALQIPQTTSCKEKPKAFKHIDKPKELQEQNHQGFGGADDPGVFLEEGLVGSPTMVEGACLEGGGSG